MMAMHMLITYFRMYIPYVVLVNYTKLIIHAVMRAGCCLDPCLCRHVGRGASSIFV